MLLAQEELLAVGVEKHLLHLDLVDLGLQFCRVHLFQRLRPLRRLSGARLDRGGCAVATDRRREVWVCNYDPPRNVAGYRPY